MYKENTTYKKLRARDQFYWSYYTPRKLCLWEGILFSRCPSVRLNIRPCVRNVLFPKYLEESLMEFHQILQTHSYAQGKLLIKIKGYGPILLELFPFVILNGFCIGSFLNILKSH